MKVQLNGKEYVCNLAPQHVFEPMLQHFFYQLSVSDGGGGGRPTLWRAARGGELMWQRADGRDGAELIMCCVYEYKYAKY
jgi:hypothetical protein